MFKELIQMLSPVLKLYYDTPLHMWSDPADSEFFSYALISKGYPRVWRQTLAGLDMSGVSCGGHLCAIVFIDLTSDMSQKPFGSSMI